MPRYTRETKAWWPETPSTPLPSLQVDAAEATDTGLVDVDGNRIMKLPDPIGFIR